MTSPDLAWADKMLAKDYATSRRFLRSAIRSVSFVNSTIPTVVRYEDGKICVNLIITDRDTGVVGAAIEFTFNPAQPGINLTSKELAIEWIYQVVRYTWVHELNEAMYVNGRRRRDLHDGQGRAIPPPGEYPP